MSSLGIGKHLAITTIAAVVATAGVLDWSAYRAGVRAERKATAYHELPPDFCHTCHTGAAIDRKMAEKRGDFVPPAPAK